MYQFKKLTTDTFSTGTTTVPTTFSATPWMKSGRNSKTSSQNKNSRNPQVLREPLLRRFIAITKREHERKLRLRRPILKRPAGKSLTLGNNKRDLRTRRNGIQRISEN